MGNKVTIFDISKEAGVSIATVSRVLNGAGNVSENTKKKVLNAALKFGYSPNSVANAIGDTSTKTIGIISADCSDLFLAKAIFFTANALRQAGYETFIISSGYDHKGACEAVLTMLAKHVDGIILLGSQFIFDSDSDNDYIREAAKKVPIMLYNAELDFDNIYCCFCDDMKATFDGVEYAILSGCKRILFIYDSVSYANKKKLAGYQSALLTHDLTVSKEYYRYYDGDRDSANDIARFIEGIANEGLLFDCIVCSDDYVAMGAIKYCRQKGLSIPDDMSVIGYNNSLLATCCDPELTSIHNKVEDITSQLVRTLLEVLNGSMMPQKTVFSGELIIRKTTK